MISNEEKKALENDILNDILYDIDMQLYDEFNDKIATMNDHLGDIYSLRDIEEVENAQKEKEIELLRIAVAKQQKEIEYYKKQIPQDKIFYYSEKDYISKDKIREKIKEEEDYMILFTNDKEKFNRYKYARNTLEKLLKENNND